MSLARDGLEDREPAATRAVPGAVARLRTPLRVLQPAASQRLSCRKITCKAFPFVVEEHRVTSYFLLVKEEEEEEGKKEEAMYRWRRCGGGLPVAGEDFWLLFSGVSWWKRAAQIAEETGFASGTRK